MRIPFTKAHGAGNDFLLTWMKDAPRENHAEAARAICERHTGIGADGWILVSQPPAGEKTYDGAIQLFNSHGSLAELSGTATRCPVRHDRRRRQPAVRDSRVRFRVPMA